MKRSAAGMLTTALLCLGSPVWAADVDGKQPIICAPTDILSCSSTGNCNRETAETVNLPRFLKIDIAHKQITGTRVSGDSLVTAIGDIHQLPETIVLQGTEGSYMWSLMITQKTGTMTLTVGGNEIGFVAFGACMPG